MKRTFDIFFSLIVLIIFSPICLIFILLVWLNDFKSPIYVAKRVGLNGRLFSMYKIRTMKINADKTKVDSTSNDDPRIIPIGKIIRKYKIDELVQFANVLLGSMSVVGPRPNVKRDTDLYTDLENNILKVKPGITDFASIVFSDEGKILCGFESPDIAYNQLIRPGKSRLALFYISNYNLKLDLALILYTVVALFSRKKALRMITQKLKSLNAPIDLILIASRKEKLVPLAPPGSDEILKERDIS